MTKRNSPTQFSKEEIEFLLEGVRTLLYPYVNQGGLNERRDALAKLLTKVEALRS